VALPGRTSLKRPAADADRKGVQRRVARLAYVGWQASCLVALAAFADVWAAVVFDWPMSLAAPLEILCGLEIALSGCLVATDWHGATNRLRARHRLERGRRGPVFAWFCRDSRTWWRVTGVIVACAGLVLVGTGAFLIAL
jgi:hypothetical protein